MSAFKAYERRAPRVSAVRWNVPRKEPSHVPGKPVVWTLRPQLGYEVEGVPNVRPTSYREVSELLGTSGCSRTDDVNMWDWSVLGILETPRGKIVVSPGDWVVMEIEEPKSTYVVTDEEFKLMFRQLQVKNKVYKVYAPGAYGIIDKLDDEDQKLLDREISDLPRQDGSEKPDFIKNLQVYTANRMLRHWYHTGHHSVRLSVSNVTGGTFDATGLWSKPVFTFRIAKIITE